MATFVPTTPLLVSDQAVSLLAKTVVETAPGVFALNTVGGGGGSEIPIKFDVFNGSLATFVPTTPLLVSDQAGSLLAKTVVETTPGVLALNTVGGGGGSEIPIKFDSFNGSKLSKYKYVSGAYYYPDYNNYRYILKYLNKELNIISLTSKNGGQIDLGFDDELVFYEGFSSSSVFSTTIPSNYQPVGLPE